MSDEEQETVRRLEREALMHDAAAERLESDARHRRISAESARKGAEYIRKQHGT